MECFHPTVMRERWLTHTLCRRYAAVSFRTVSEFRFESGAHENRTICWAFGCLVNGDSEILGAWTGEDEPETVRVAIQDLYYRGVEFVRCGLGLRTGEAQFLATFRGSTVYPSIEQSMASALKAARPMHRPAMSRLLRASIGNPAVMEVPVTSPEISSEDLRHKYPALFSQWDETVAAFRRVLVLPEPYRRHALSVDQTAAELQGRLTGSIFRHGPFADSAEAVNFVVDWLVRNDLRLVRERAEQVLRASDVRSVLSHRVDLLSGTAGASTMAQGGLP